MISAHSGIVFIAGGGKYGFGAAMFLLNKGDWDVVVCDEDWRCQASALLKNTVEPKQLRSSLRLRVPTLVIGDAVESPPGY